MIKKIENKVNKIVLNNNRNRNLVKTTCNIEKQIKI